MDTKSASRINQGVALHQQGRLDDAERIYRDVLARWPRSADALHLLGIIAKQKRQYLQAISLIEQAISISPDAANIADYHSNCGEAYRAVFDYEKALICYERACRVVAAPRPAVLFNIAGCMQELGRYRESIVYFDQVLAMQPGYARAHFRRAYAHLPIEQYEAGWRDYEWHIEAATGERYLRDPRDPQSLLPRPSDLLPIDWQDKRVLLCQDQGLGDELCILRFLPRLAAQGARVVYQPPEKLRPLLRRSGCCELHTPDDMDFDHVFSSSELPLLTGMSRTDQIPLPVALTPRADLLKRYRQMLDELPKPWVGITWRAGTPEIQQGQFKEVPVRLLAQALRQQPGTIIVLQRNLDDRDLTRFSDRQILNLSRESESLEDALALMSLLDRYIAVSNTNVHLRSSLGLPSEVLTTTAPIDYRWPRHLKNSPWLPGCRSLKQGLDGTWDDAMRALAPN